ncbi:Fe-S protein assembly co-chaperone HscB [Candidatus Parabeggiatoa sp. HSG14]|uniref:Fe-S protein assembly co-chaperone HscB n=1 Tax=Candidatus Parabeggiatoa sp. HSG14 TaxID=3055593 RepID=UPI0025A83422|nr:Fe-S protein assembly co-chaperone HscB [Thiotrichales bacterium HSG14]
MSLSTNHFEVFDLPISFDIDTEILAQRYRDSQRTVHPDKYANAPERDRRLAMQKATQINEAFQTLKKPLTRGLYLLQLQGIDTNDSNVAMDGEFLMEQMELREELASIKQQANPLDALSVFLNRIEQHQQHLTNTLSQQFAQKAYQSAHDNVRKFQFFIRLHEEALRLEEELI